MEDAERKIVKSRSRLAGNSAALAVCGAAGMLFTLAQISILSRYMEGGEFGLFVALRGFSLLLSTVVLLGLPQALIRFIPSYQNRGLRSRVLIMFGASAAVVTAAGALVVLTADSWRSLIPGGMSAAPSGDVLFWTALSSVPLALKLLLYGGFNGQRTMHLQMFYELAYLLMLTAGMAAMRSSLGIVLLFRMMAGLNAAVFVAGVPAFLANARKAQAGSGGVSPEVVTPSFPAYLAGSLVLSLVALAFTDFDRFLMSSALPLAAISVFHVASRINSLLKRFLGFPVIALQPEITRIYEEGRSAELGRMIELFTKVTVVMALFMTSLAFVAGREAIRLVSGESFQPAYPVLAILLPCVPIAAFIAPLISAMKGLHYMRWAVLSDFVWMSVYFGSFFFFISRFGVAGMAVAQLAASIVQMTVVVAASKKEGIYSGAGKGTWKMLVVAAVFGAAGTAASGAWGLSAVIAFVAVSPFVLRESLVRLRMFDSQEAGMIRDMAGRGVAGALVAWLLPGGGD